MCVMFFRVARGCGQLGSQGGVCGGGFGVKVQFCHWLAGDLGLSLSSFIKSMRRMMSTFHDCSED